MIKNNYLFIKSIRKSNEKLNCLVENNDLYDLCSLKLSTEVSVSFLPFDATVGLQREYKLR